MIKSEVKDNLIYYTVYDPNGGIIIITSCRKIAQEAHRYGRI
jgi:hypothetical protein